MIVTIQKNYDKNHIVVSSPFGCFSGKFYGGAIFPHKAYDIEIEVSKIFTPDDFMISENNSYNIVTLNGITRIVCCVEEIDTDVLYLRLGLDLIAIEILSNADYHKFLGAYVTLSCDNLLLYDTGVLASKM